MAKKQIILGTMNATKSAQLIMKAFNLRAKQGKKVLAFKPATDNRDAYGYITSRALSERLPAIVIERDDNLKMTTAVWSKNPHVILVDEIQFFTEKQIEELTAISHNYGIPIYVYGLMMSFNGKMFDTVKRAIECGFEVVTLEMPCDHCNEEATHHLLYMNGELQKEGEAINVEDFKNKEQRYESVCYECYYKKMNS
ncbi:MAG: thymidine kinase [Gammaproteobacteria bacterium]